MAREERIDIHSYARQYRNAERAVRDSDLSARNKELIFGYRDACLRLNLCGEVRLIRVMGALTLFGRMLGKDFDTLTRDDINELVSRLRRADPPYSPETLGTYKAIIKKFLTWVLVPHEFPTRTPPAVVAWITCHVRAKDRRPLQARDFLTADEFARLLSVCDNARDRAFVSALWETGGRIAEIGNRQIKDLTKVQHGYLLDVNGKTGARTPLLVSSAPYLSAWLAYHPAAGNPEAPLWVHLHAQSNRSYIRYGTMRKLLITLFARSGIKKRPNPHGLRHGRTSHLAGRGLMTEPQLKAYLGWSQSSNMLARYAHLKTSDANNAIIAENGLAPLPTRTAEPTVRVCATCQEPNPFTASYCVRCSNPVTEQATRQAHEHQEQTQTVLLQLAQVLADKGLLDEAATQVHNAGLGKALKALATATSASKQQP